MALRILALDLATITGWAHSCCQSGVWNLAIGRDESSGMRLLRFTGKLAEIKASVGIDVIVFEQVILGRGPQANANATILAAKLQAIIESYCLANVIEHCSYHNNTIKAHAIPAMPGTKCVRDKDAMFDAARRRWPDVEIVDHNQADAMWLLDLAMSELTPAETER